MPADDPLLGHGRQIIIREDWLKLTDFDPDNVIKLGPIRPRPKQTEGTGII